MSESSNLTQAFPHHLNDDFRSSVRSILQNDTISIADSNRSMIKHKLKRIQQETEYVAKHNEKFQLLTKREKEIIQLILRGKNNPRIAEDLYISRRTVEQHRKNINRKLEISSGAELYTFAYSFNLV